MKFVAVILLLVGAIGFFALNISLGVFDDLFSGNQKGETLGEVLEKQPAGNFSLQEPKKDISVSTPLRIFQPSSPSISLSAAGVLQWTNIHRQAAGLPVLARSAVLDAVATKKVQDMFLRQYFEHVSPLGVGVSDLAESTGYEFIAIGENLALGNYESDQVLVQAWMDSPGHRANILNARYREIGIALQQGTFEGDFTWLAVQVFGLPLAACDSPSEILKRTIELEQARIAEFALTLDQKRRELEQEHIQEYNTQVEQYNNLVAQMRMNINTYNAQVQAFNACANQ